MTALRPDDRFHSSCPAHTGIRRCSDLAALNSGTKGAVVDHEHDGSDSGLRTTDRTQRRGQSVTVSREDCVGHGFLIDSTEGLFD